MTEHVDFFFSDYPSVQSQRLYAATRECLAHGSRIEPHDPIPNEAVTLHLSTNAHLPIEYVAIYYTVDGSEPAGRRGSATHGIAIQAEMSEVASQAQNGLTIQPWQARLPGQPEGTLVRYRADGWNLSDPEQHWYADSVDPVGIVPSDGRRFAYSVDYWSTPAWWHDTVIYHIFVDRFHAAQGESRMKNYGEDKITSFFGGTLKGILEKLDYLQSLGINCLWLSPIFESPTHHGYNASDYLTVAKRYGTNEQLRQLTNEAHQRGIRIILDFVANHTSDEHPAFIAAKKMSDGPTANWYEFDNSLPGGYRSYVQVQGMPELRTDHPDVQRYLIESALHWLGDFRADGLRMDYVPGPSHSFWTMLQKAVKEQFPQAITLGEITAPQAEIADYAGRLDGFMDFPLAKLLRSTFALRSTSLAALLTFLIERQKNGETAGMSTATLLDNHDTHRFLWLADGKVERLKLAAVCQMTLVGSPILYYGTEVGLSQYDNAHKENAHARAPMLWEEKQNVSLLTFYRHLINLRHTYTTLRYGKMASIAIERQETRAEAHEQIGAYIRYFNNSVFLIVLNNTEHAAKICLNLGEALAKITMCHKMQMLWYNLLPWRELADITWEQDQVTLEISAMEAGIYTPDYSEGYQGAQGTQRNLGV